MSHIGRVPTGGEGNRNQEYDRITQAPSFPIAVLLVILPVVGALQFRAIAFFVVFGLLFSIVQHRRCNGRWPVPPLAGPLLPLLAIGGLASVSGAWALDPMRAVLTGLKVTGFALLGAGAARAVTEDPLASRCVPQGLMVGLALGATVAVADVLTAHAIRSGVRALASGRLEWISGLKPTLSIFAVLLPLAWAQTAAPSLLRIIVFFAVISAAALIPAETARISLLVGLCVLAIAHAARLATKILLAGCAGAVFLAAPLFITLALPRLPSLEAIPPSAAHRVLIWDFVGDRIAERPIFGWGAEASRAIPGGKEAFPIETLARFGIGSEPRRIWFSQVQRLPLHPHNAALQIWLELGLLGAGLAAWFAAALGLAAARIGPGALGALAAGTVTASLSYGVWQTWWIGLGLLIAAALPGLKAGSAASRRN